MHSFCSGRAFEIQLNYYNIADGENDADQSIMRTVICQERY